MRRGKAARLRRRRQRRRVLAGHRRPRRGLEGHALRQTPGDGLLLLRVLCVLDLLSVRVRLPRLLPRQLHPGLRSVLLRLLRHVCLGAARLAAL